MKKSSDERLNVDPSPVEGVLWAKIRRSDPKNAFLSRCIGCRTSFPEASE
jgi:hypothetical protein